MVSPQKFEEPGLYELDRQSHKRRQGWHCWELQDEPFSFCGWTGTACVDLRNRVLSSHLIGFLLRATKKKRKSALKDWGITYVSPRQCFLQVSTNTLQQVKTFKCLGMVFTSDKSRKKGVDTRIGRANAVLRELFCSVVAKQGLSNKANFSVSKSVFVPILTCGQVS